MDFTKVHYEKVSEFLGPWSIMLVKITIMSLLLVTAARAVELAYMSVRQVLMAICLGIYLDIKNLLLLLRPSSKKKEETNHDTNLVFSQASRLPLPTRTY